MYNNKIAYIGLCIAALFLLAPDRAHLLDHALHHDEALAILLGRAQLAGQPCGGACAQHTGSVLIHPTLAALGEGWEGLYGARLISVGFGLLLLAAVAVTGWLLMGPTGGWLAGALLLVQAPFLYISRMALYDVAAASCLGVAVAALIAAERSRASRWAGGWLLVAAISLVGASLAKYVTTLYLPVALAIVLWRFRIVQSLICFVLPAALLGGAYLWQVAPLLVDVVNQARNVALRGEADFTVMALAGMLARWLSWLSLLALAAFAPTFVSMRGVSMQGVSMRGRRDRPAVNRAVWLLLVLAALLIPLVHLATGAVQGLNKNVVQALVLLAPAAAYGLLQLSRPFHLARAVNAQWLLIGVVLAGLAWGGVRQRAWLERQYPDLSPVVAELEQVVTPQSVVMADADALFRYALEDRLIQEQVVLSYWVDYDGLGGEAGALHFVGAQRPDYVVLDGYYGESAQHERLKAAMGANYQLRRQWPMRMSWGERSVQVYERKGVTT